jgi:predicted Na+-dependent transporter
MASFPQVSQNMFGYTVKFQRRHLGNRVSSIALLFIIYGLFSNGVRAGAVATGKSPF